MKEVKSLHRVKYSDLTQLIETLGTYARHEHEGANLLFCEFAEWLSKQKGSVTLTKWSEEK